MAIYIVSKLDNKEYCKTNGQFTRHLRNYNMTYRQYYEKYITGVEEICPYCSSPKSFYQHTNSYAQTCGSNNCYGLLISDIKSEFSDEKNQQINEKRKSSNLEKYGCEFVLSDIKIRDKIKKTRMQIMADGRTKEKHIQEAASNAKLKKYGSKSYNNSKKASATRKNFDSVTKNKISDKRRETNLLKYGIENPLLNYDISSKSAKGNSSIKEFKLPSGKILGIRGAEPIAISTLLEIYPENDICILDNNDILGSNVPILEYVDENRHKRKYYPDIFVPNENRIIEVKSRWWYDGYSREKYKSRLINNNKKKQACIDAGYLFEFWIYETDGSCTVIK